MGRTIILAALVRFLYTSENPTNIPMAISKTAIPSLKPSRAPFVMKAPRIPSRRNVVPGPETFKPTPQEKPVTTFDPEHPTPFQNDFQLHPIFY